MDPCACSDHAETYWALLTSLPHWGLEITIMIVFDGLVGALAWPFVKRHWRHHVKHDDIHKEE